MMLPRLPTEQHRTLTQEPTREPANGLICPRVSVCRTLVGTLLYGLVPRLTAPLLYGLILWSFLIEIIGSSLTSNHWLLDTAVLSHLGPVPATSLNWTVIAWLSGLAAIASLAGVAAFKQRDLATA